MHVCACTNIMSNLCACMCTSDISNAPHRCSKLDAVFKCPDKVGVGEFDDVEIVRSLHVLNPLVGLALWVNHERPSTSIAGRRKRRLDKSCDLALQGHSKTDYLMTIPFSIENASVGRPAIFHDLILTGSPRVLLREKSVLHGIPFCWQSLLHSLVCS